MPIRQYVRVDQNEDGSPATRPEGGAKGSSTLSEARETGRKKERGREKRTETVSEGAWEVLADSGQRGISGWTGDGGKAGEEEEEAQAASCSNGNIINGKQQRGEPGTKPGP